MWSDDEDGCYLGSYGGNLTSALQAQTSPCGPRLLGFMPPGPAPTDWPEERLAVETL